MIVIGLRGFRVFLLGFFAAILVLDLPLTADAASLQCTEQDARKAEAESSTLRSWGDIYNSYRRYRHCDDGAISEGYTNSVATLLATGWDQVGELMTLIRAHPKFEDFVFHHLDATMTSDQRREIKENVRSNCPTTSIHLCVAINKHFADMDSK